MDVKFSLDDNEKKVFERIYPLLKPNDVANALAKMMTIELLRLLDGRKRYLSLSHQYIEWIEQIYETLTPKEEYTERRIQNDFRFPPGTASYMARVLRSRQNTQLHTNAVVALGKILQSLHSDCKGVVSAGAQNKVCRLTSRSYEVLNDIVGSIFARIPDSALEAPQITARMRGFVEVSINLRQIHEIINEYVTMFSDIAKDNGYAKVAALK